MLVKNVFYVLYRKNIEIYGGGGLIVKQIDFSLGGGSLIERQIEFSWGGVEKVLIKKSNGPSI